MTARYETAIMLPINVNIMRRINTRLLVKLDAIVYK